MIEDYLFDFQHELLMYCQSDVRLLKQGCLNFQREFKAMIHCIAIASACDIAYRRNWMPEIESRGTDAWMETSLQSVHGSTRVVALETKGTES